MRTTKIYFTYILTNSNNTVLYVGMTSNLEQRVHQHKIKFFEGFTKRYNIDKLVYFETFTYVKDAIKREKQIKSYNRSKKNNLIENSNTDWKELKPPKNVY
nr:GIY-YIG nuclease family protein [uncultured Brumimicrobium sp.]